MTDCGGVEEDAGGMQLTPPWLHPPEQPAIPVVIPMQAMLKRNKKVLPIKSLFFRFINLPSCP